MPISIWSLTAHTTGKNDVEKKHQNSDAILQSNNMSSSTISLTGRLPIIPPCPSGGRQGVDKREWLKGEKNFSKGIPKPAKIVGKLNHLTEYQRSMSTMSIEMAGIRHTQAGNHANFFFKRHHGRRKSIEPSEKNKLNVTVTRSSSMRQETSISKSKFRSINILSRRKDFRNQASTAKQEILPPAPRVTSPHPVRRNMATPHPPNPTPKTPKHHKVEAQSTPEPGGEETVPLVDKHKRAKRTPPEKPPRTLSTFIDTNEQDELFRKLAKHGGVQSDNQGGAGDVTISGLKATELQSNSSIQPPPTHMVPPDNDYEARPYALPTTVGKALFRGRSQGFLPLGHSSYYAEVFPKRVAVSNGCDPLALSSEDYDTLEPDEVSPLYTSPVPSAVSATSSVSQFPFDLQPSSPQTQDSQISPDTLDSYYALPCDSPNDDHTNSLGVNPGNNTPPSDSLESYYTLPCDSLNDDEDNSIGADTQLSDTIDSFYSMPSAGLMEGQADSRRVRSHIYTPPASPPIQNSLTNTLNIHLLQIMTNTLKTLCEHEANKLTCKESLWSTGWEDIEVVSETEVNCKGKVFSIVVCGWLQACVVCV